MEHFIERRQNASFDRRERSRGRRVSDVVSWGYCHGRRAYDALPPGTERPRSADRNPGRRSTDLGLPEGARRQQSSRRVRDAIRGF